MRKIVSFVLVLAMVLTGAAAAFGATPTDVVGTPYEAAVSGLMEKGVIVGYPDGIFQPTAYISRAEACMIVVKSMGVTDEDLQAVAKSGFPDLVGYDWASKYIDYAAANEVISGYPDGTFRPNASVTYNEMAAMLVRALRFHAADLTGTWPVNFVTKAEVLGIFSGITYQGNAAAIRGHAAMMGYSVVDAIREAHRTGGEVIEPEPTYADLAGPLANYSGRAFGIILDKASVLNEDGDVVEQVEFLFGDDILYLNTDGKFTVDLADQDLYLNLGALSGVKMRNGIVTAVAVGDQTTSFAAIGTLTTFENHDISSWELVQDANGDVIKVNDGYKAIIDTASVYVATIEQVDGSDAITGYTDGGLSDIDEGTYVRLYTITGDNPGVVEIVLVSEINPSRR
jgi:hypothetical protein